MSLRPARPSPARLSPARPGLLIGAVRLYQALHQGRPSPCRYVPTCSAYAIEALDRHGSVRGTWLSARRLLRCHPWGGHGADPVPELPGVRPSPHEKAKTCCTPSAS